MSESWVEVSEGSGKKLHTNTRSISGSTVHDEVVALGEKYLASYAAGTAGLSGATDETVRMSINAGSSKIVRIRAITLQLRVATAAGFLQIAVMRTTTAHTGGTVLTAAPLDTSDAAAGATVRLSPTGGGTESTTLHTIAIATAAAAPQNTAFYRWEFSQTKPLMIAAGTANGIQLKVVTEIAGSAFNAMIEFDESDF